MNLMWERSSLILQFCMETTIKQLMCEIHARLNISKVFLIRYFRYTRNHLEMKSSNFSAKRKAIRVHLLCTFWRVCKLLGL